MCAVIKRGILGGFQNKIANVVGSSWKGIATMRSLPISVANPNTSLQQTQRTKFAMAAKFGSKILSSVIKPQWDRFAQQESGYNAWLRRNIENFDMYGPVAASQLVFSEGTLQTTIVTVATANAGADTVTITTVSPAGGDQLDTDEINYVLYNDTSKKYIGSGNIFNRLNEGVPHTVQADIGFVTGNSIFIYVFCRRADGTKVSNTTFVTRVAVA